MHPNCGLGERDGVVRAVPAEEHRLALHGELLDVRLLVRGEAARAHALRRDAQRGGDGRDGGGVIPAEERHADVARGEGVEDGLRLGAERVGEPEGGDEAHAVDNAERRQTLGEHGLDGRVGLHPDPLRAPAAE